MPGASGAAPEMVHTYTVMYRHLSVGCDNVETVFKQGVGFDPVKLVESVKGKAGLW